LRPYAHRMTGTAAGVSRCAPAVCTPRRAVRAAGVWLQDSQRSRSALAVYNAFGRPLAVLIHDAPPCRMPVRCGRRARRPRGVRRAAPPGPAASARVRAARVR
jgi:hypothetical protein